MTKKIQILCTLGPSSLNRKFLNLKKDEHLVRLHIGLEDPKDLILDLLLRVIITGLDQEQAIKRLTDL